MKSFFILILLASLATIETRGGTILGIVRAKGKESAEGEAGSDKYGSKKFKFAERVNYEDMRDFIVFIEGPLPGLHLKPPVKPVEVVTQKDATFSPHVLPVMAGTVVEWPNRDEIVHNAFSFSETKPFDLNLYGKGEVKKVMFDKAGRADVFCSIHTRMYCIVLVLENPYFASADLKGRYVIPNVPAGTYKLKAWHERLPAATSDVIVPETGEVKVDFTLGILNLPKY